MARGNQEKGWGRNGQAAGNPALETGFAVGVALLCVSPLQRDATRTGFRANRMPHAAAGPEPGPGPFRKVSRTNTESAWGHSCTGHHRLVGGALAAAEEPEGLSESKTAQPVGLADRRLYFHGFRALPFADAVTNYCGSARGRHAQLSTYWVTGPRPVEERRGPRRSGSQHGLTEGRKQNRR